MARRKLCPYCEKPLSHSPQARELHRISHILEGIETVLTDLVGIVGKVGK
jgi:hypothetical protein